MAGRLLSRGEVETLIRERQVGPLTGFRSKAKKRFDAVLKLFVREQALPDLVEGEKVAH